MRILFIISLFIVVLTLSATGLTVQLAKQNTALVDARAEAAALHQEISGFRAEVLEARNALAEMRVSISDRTTSLDHLLDSMILAIGESVVVTNKAADIAGELDYVVNYMRQWVWENFPGGK